MTPQRLIKKIATVASDSNLGDLERAVEICKLQIRLCAMHMQEAEQQGDESRQHRWSKLAAEWDKELRNAVKERNQDMLPEVLERLAQYQNAEEQFAAFAKH